MLLWLTVRENHDVLTVQITSIRKLKPSQTEAYYLTIKESFLQGQQIELKNERFVEDSQNGKLENVTMNYKM